MTTYADIDHDEGDLSEYDAEDGDVRYQAVGGYNDSGSIFCNGDAAAAFGTKDLGVIGNTLYVRARINVASGFAGTVLSGRETGGDPTFALTVSDSGSNAVGLSLKVYTNAGSETYSLTMPYAVVGIFWIELMITTGATRGTCAAWVNDNVALTTQIYGPNSNKKTEDLDIGISASTANARCNIDEIQAGDARVSAPGWTPVLIDTRAEQGRTYERWGVTGEPTGGWQAFTDKTSGFRTIKMEIIRGAVDIVELQDPSGNDVYRAVAEYGAAPDADIRGRVLFPNIAPLVRFRRVGQIAAVKASIEFTTP